jgi:CDP-diacylglycerol--serine O-phosphatidyltransferase
MKPLQKKWSRKRNRRGIYILPNLLTTASMFGGFFAIIAAIQARYEASAIAILVSWIFDTLDGKIARFTRSTSQFGSEYDSLSDLVAFGVAPAVLAFLWALQPFGRLGWLASFMYVVCGALRLARFNVQKDTMEPKYFKGLPIPAAGCLIASLVLLAVALGELPGSKHILSIILIYVLSFLMVSNIEYLSFKEFELKKQKPFNVLIIVILGLMVIAYKPKIMIFFLFSAYVLLGPAIKIYRHQKRRSMKKRPMEDLPAIEED